MSSRYCLSPNRKSWGAGKKNIHPPPCVTCHMSCVRCHMACVTFFLPFLQSDGASRFNVCYQLGLPLPVKVLKEEKQGLINKTY